MNVCKDDASILIIYTGGTIGMIENPETGSLEAFNFEHLEEHVPELKNLGYKISSIQFDPPMDSSEMGPDSWMKIVHVIAEHYHDYDGFVVLHGTDTMAFTASALSFMLENLSKPVVLTGSQLPIGMLRTDGKENLITAIEIAAARENDMPLVPEVCIFFENDLLRGIVPARRMRIISMRSVPIIILRWHMPVFRLSMMSPRFTIRYPGNR